FKLKFSFYYGKHKLLQQQSSKLEATEDIPPSSSSDSIDNNNNHKDRRDRRSPSINVILVNREIIFQLHKKHFKNTLIQKGKHQ
ncbi:2550_t:CDS:1, partial [Ambispora gerdemannii]